MKITLESTDRLIEVNGTQARVWTGTSERGVGVSAVIVRLAIRSDADAMLAHERKERGEE